MGQKLKIVKTSSLSQEAQLLGWKSTRDSENLKLKPGMYRVSRSKSNPEQDKLPDIRYWDGKNWIGKNGYPVKGIDQGRGLRYYNYYGAIENHPVIVFLEGQKQRNNG